MSKTLRTVGMVVGAVALVATGVGALAGAGVLGAGAAGAAGTVAGISTATITAVGTYASVAAGVLSMAAAATAPGFSAEGSATSFTTNPQSGLPYAMGRTRMSGLRVYARTYDGFKQQSKHDILAFVAMLSIAGPIHSIEKFTADNEVVTFESGGTAIGRFDDYMSQKVSLGAPGAAALNDEFGGKPFPDWGTNHKLSGIAHAQWALRFDTDGDLYGAGAPEPAWVGKWVKVYDPRKDSTYPGGSGSHRALNESTYEWSDNPGLHALAWALGRWQNGKRVCGIGAPVANIRVAEFIECANVCDANGWKVGGVEWTTDSKWDTLKRILQAGGAIPTQTGAMIGCLTSTPRTAIATIESRHLLDGLSLSATKSRRDRFNTVIPRYVDEDSDWAVISGTAVQESAYVTADGGQRTKEIDFPLVQVFAGETAEQPGQLAAYAIVNSREAGPFTWTTGPEWIGLKTGDVVYLNVPEEGLVNQSVLITRRAPDPATGKVSFAGETETYSKHAYALGQSTTPPAPFSLIAPDLKPAAPLSANWSVSGATSGEGFPALLVTGASEMPSADAIVIDYRKSGDGEWISSAILSAVGPVSHTIAPLESETAYDVRIGYRVGTALGNFTLFASVTTGLGKVTVIEGQLQDQDAALGQLETDTAQALTEIAAAQTTITNMQAAAEAVQASLDAAQADIVAQGASITAQGAAIADITVNIGALADDITAAGGEIDTLQTTVGQHGANITTLQTTVSNHTGTLATHTSQISTANANISTNANAITTLNGSVADLNIKVSASNPNLVVNGGPENGTSGWSTADTLTPGISGSGWGRFLRLTSTDGTAFARSTSFGVSAGNPVIATCDSNFWGAGVTPSTVMRLQIIWYNGTGGEISRTPGATRTGAHSFSATGANRALNAVTGVAPPSTASASVLAEFWNGSSGDVVNLDLRQIKAEVGTKWTPFSNEASVVQSFTAISTLDGQYASLSSTVSAQGASISSLQSASSTQAGQIATLSNTVSTQGASITTAQNAITTLNGSVADLNIKVTAANPNLLPNGGFENGLAGLTVTPSGGWYVVNDGYGRRLASNTTWTGYRHIFFGNIALPSSGPCTVSADARYIGQTVDGTNSFASRIEVHCYGISGASTGPYFSSDWRIANHNFSDTGADRIKLTFTAHPGTTQIGVRLTNRADTALTSVSMGWRQAKLERGSVATTWSNEASVAQVFAAINTLDGQYASLSSTVSAQGASITSLQSASTTQAGQIATLTTGLSTASSNITINANAITTTNSNVANLTTRVSSAEGSITSAQNAITTLQGTTATLTTTLSASMGGTGNLLTNTSFDNGYVGWTTSSGSGIDSIAFNWQVGDASLQNENYIDIYQGSATAAGWAEYRQDFAVEESKFYEASVWARTARCNALIRTWFYDEAGANLGEAGPSWQSVGSGETLKDYTRNHWVRQAPTGAVRMRIALRKAGTLTGSNSWVRFIRPQVVETFDGAPSPRAFSHGSNKASVVQNASALATLTTQYASLSSTVSTQGVTITSQQTAITTINGNITTLFGKWGFEIDVNGYVSGLVQNNNGSRSDAIWRVDKLAIGAPGASTDYPFQVVGSTTYLKNAKIQDAAISNAKIGDLEVSTLKIANEAITKSYYATLATTTPSLTVGAETSILSLSVAGVTAGEVLRLSGILRLLCPDDLEGELIVRYTVNGGVINEVTNDGYKFDSDGGAATRMAVPISRSFVAPSAGTYLFYLIYYNRKSGTNAAAGTNIDVMRQRR